MAKMKRGDYTTEDVSQESVGLIAKRSKRKGLFPQRKRPLRPQNNFGHNVGMSFIFPQICNINEVPVRELGSISSRMKMCLQ